jgi:hypothetical protein
MPDARCPHCRSWARREQWAAALEQRFPFVIVCPRCARESDVTEVEYRLGAPTPVGQTCDRCSAPLPARDDPEYEDWTFVPGEGGRAGEIVCPRCVLLTELAARIGWEREHGYRWRATPRP